MALSRYACKKLYDTGTNITLLVIACQGQQVSTAGCVVITQIVQALEGAIVGLRDQLEALTILDETALTWPGLSLV